MTAFDVDAQISALAGDRSSGASELGRQALEVAAQYALSCPAQSREALLKQLKAKGAVLRTVRPSMTPIANLVDRWLGTLDTLSPGTLEQVRAQAAERARDLVDASKEAVDALASEVCTLVGSGKTVLTHSLSSSLKQALLLYAPGEIRVIASESRPLNEGVSLAKELSSAEIETVLITDAQMGLFVPEADLVLVGADSLLADGSVVNKAGTYLLALAARDKGIPFYVCCETFKCRTVEQGAPELEEMDPAELGVAAMDHVRVRNIYFDLTPAHLVTGWISEQGMKRYSGTT